MSKSKVKTSVEGLIISHGIEKGEACFVVFPSSSSASAETLSARKPGKEVDRFEKGTQVLVKELGKTIERLKKDSYLKDAEIIQTHIILLEDKGFHRRVKEKIKTRRLTAESAIEKTMQEILEALESSGSPLFSERASDFRDIVMRLKSKLARKEASPLKKYLKKFQNPVVITKELLPSLVLEARKEGVKAILIENGTSLSHAAILAKSFAIPVLKIENLYELGLKDKDEVLVDAAKGRLVIQPGKEEIDRMRTLKESRDALEPSSLPMKIWINIVDPTQMSSEDLESVEGIGLYRTESLFMEKKIDFPDEDEQYRVYSILFEKAGDRPVTIRTLDIGGDKTVPYFSFGPQENPYLGFRAHRIYRFHQEIFITQMRAILRAAAYSSNLRVMYPMIENVDELLFVQNLLKEAVRSLRKEGIRHNREFRQGVLVEVPSAVWDFRRLLGLVDFAGLGTNDLLQYFFAVDRNNANVAGAYGPESPTSLRMLKGLVETAKELDKPLNICGEIASDVHFLPLLVGLGFEHISIDFHAMPSVKETLAGLDISSCKQVLQACLEVEKAGDVRTILKKFNPLNNKMRVEVPSERQGELIDPVCKMVVHTEGNELIAQYEGNRYYFCSKRCRDKFLSEKGG